MSGDEIPAPEMKREITVRAAEHEVLLSFNSDWHAAAFDDWFNARGLTLFREWAAKHKSEYLW